MKFTFPIPKKWMTIAVIGLFIALVFFVWDNVLILDDLRHPHYESLPSQLLAEEMPAPSGTESTNSNTDSAPAAKKGYSIIINLDECNMYVYKNGELLKTYPVSGGKRATPSPTGTWRITSKDTWGEGFGGAWMGINVPWGKYGIHGTVYPWFVGRQNASKGCIRMLNKDAKELYKLVPHGTTVTIVQNSVPFRVMKSGDIGSDVLELQKALKKLGYFNGYCGGKFGSDTQRSVQKFQKEHKLYGAGKVTQQTHNLIKQKATKKDAELQRQQQEQLEQEKQQETPQEQQPANNEKSI